MKRLFTKCMLFSSLAHALLLLIAVFATAFFSKQKETVALPPIEFIPDILVDDLLSQAGRSSNPPAPAQSDPIKREEKPAPLPSTPSIRVPKQDPKQEPKPAPKPETKATTAKPPVTPAPKVTPPKPQSKKEAATPPAPTKAKEPTPKAETKKPEPKTVVPNLNLSSRNSDAEENQRRQAQLLEAQRRQAEALRQEKQRMIREATHTLRSGLSGKMSFAFDAPGAGGASYANYGQEIVRIYRSNWIEPAEIAGHQVAKARIIVRQDGMVLKHELLNPSGNAEMDASVRRVLASIKQLPAFPKGSSDPQRTFHLDFDLQPQG